MPFTLDHVVVFLRRSRLFHKRALDLSDVLGMHKPNYLNSLSCGFCGNSKALKFFAEHKASAGGPANLYICVHCTSIYNSSMEERALDNLSHQLEWVEDRETYIPKRGDEFRSDLQVHLEILRFIANQLQLDFRDRSYFEFGSGSGMLSAAASTLFKSVLTYDLDSARLNEMKVELGAENLTVIEDVADLNVVEFDFVVSWHVFEHLVSPGDVMRSVFYKLPVGGQLYFQVPLLSERYVFPEHLFFLNENSIRYVFRHDSVELFFFYDHELGALTCFLKKLR